MDEKKQTKKNSWFYPLGTVGRDMVYNLFANFVMTFIIFCKLDSDPATAAKQLAVIGVIMICARIFDALNDPIMGFIIEKTRTKWGKFKPWLVIGMLTTAAVIIAVFNVQATGWTYVILFGVFYFLYSITFTMHDISYWGMVTNLSKDGDTRNSITSRAVLFAGIGGAVAGLAIPMLTAADNPFGLEAGKAYGLVSIIISVISLAFICFTIFGVKETNVEVKTDAQVKKNSIGKIFKVIFHNKPLLWVAIALLVQQIGNGIVGGGLGSIYVYFTFGYSGGLYSIFSTVGLAATAILMVFFPMLCKKFGRKTMMNILMVTSTIGYILMVVAGLAIPAGSTAGYWAKFAVLTVGYMLANFGQYGFYLIMMISILNTVEYNEYMSGERDEAVITSTRPLITKLGSALVAGLTSLTYIIFGISAITTKINNIVAGSDTSDTVDNVIAAIPTQTNTLILIVITAVPFVLMLVSWIIYQSKYHIDEKEYDRLVAEIDARKAQAAGEAPVVAADSDLPIDVETAPTEDNDNNK